MSLTNKCIVLDVDETLLHCDENRAIYNSLLSNSTIYTDNLRGRLFHISMDDVVHIPGQGIKSFMWGVTRPHLKEFLKFCFSYFRLVIIWSAGRRNYIEPIVDIIFHDIGQPHIIYTWEDCVTGTSHTLEKPLANMITRENIQGLMSLTNTFAIDDRFTTFTQNPANGILIPAYEPDLSIESIRKNDVALVQLQEWFMRPEVINSRDVTTLDKRNIFYVA